LNDVDDDDDDDGSRMLLYSAGGAGSVVMTTVTLDRPFSYSTSTWRDDGCLKNVSKLLPYSQHSAARSSNVDVDLRTPGEDGRHEYLITSQDYSPHLSFHLPGA